jgi:hypothetical protein
MKSGRTNDDVIREIDTLHASISRLQLSMLELIAKTDRQEAWQDSGAQDMAHFLSMRYGISRWKASRWINAAHALEGLPRLSEAFRSGQLGIDKLVELARFATAKTEADLVSWAKGVSVACVRRKADAAVRPSIEEVREADRARFLAWWYIDEGRRFGLEAELPAAEGAMVARAIERLARALPVMPGEEDPFHASARRADALVSLCSQAIASDPDPDRATVIVHAPLDALVRDEASCEIEGGGVAHPETARRLLCTARLETVIEDQAGNALTLVRTSREPSAWMMRQLRYRDSECRFPGCGARRFTQGHHILWWKRGGRTDLDNLLLLCTMHHKLVHEYGWTVTRARDGTVEWFHPDGRHHPGPAPPTENEQSTCLDLGLGSQPALAAVGL